MKKNWFARLLTVALLVGAGNAYATPTVLVDQGAQWQYNQFSAPDLWTNWAARDYNSFNWGAATWSTGNAAFGNSNGYGGLTVATNWAANTDMALRKSFNIDGTLSGDLLLNVASDNGFMVFINGTQVAKANAEGFTSYWEYSLNVSSLGFLAPGSNVIEVLAEDHGGITFFDLKLTGDVQPASVPEPGTLLLLGSGLIGLAGMRKKMVSRKS